MSKYVVRLYYKKEGYFMAREATLQVRMDLDLKEKVEALYRNMGTSFAEAVRVFAKQSIQENGMPFVVTANRGKPYGSLAKYANPALVAEEEGAYERAMVKKYEKAD
jgi:addiction module RelB/DinJ family antitoxin